MAYDIDGIEKEWERIDLIIKGARITEYPYDKTKIGPLPHVIKKKIQVDHRHKYQRQNNKGFRRLKGKYIYDFDGRQRFLTQNTNILTVKQKK